MNGDSPSPAAIVPRHIGVMHGECPVCGYSLEGLDASDTWQCPECGEPIDATTYDKARPRRLERIAVAGLFISGFVLSATGVMSIIGIPMMLLGIAVLGTPGGVGPRYRRFLTIAAVASWLPGLIGGGVLLWFLLRKAGFLP